MTRKLGRLTITVFLILAIALTLDAYNLPTGIGEIVLQRTTEPREHTTSSTSSTGPCPPGVVCTSSSSSESTSGTTSTSETSSTSTSETSSSSGTSSLTFRTIPSSTTSGPGRGPGCPYWGFLPGTVRNVTYTTTIVAISGTRTNQTNSTVVVATCVIPGFPLEGTIIGTVVGLLFVIMNRRKSRRGITN
jgi:hypothetical protein